MQVFLVGGGKGKERKRTLRCGVGALDGRAGERRRRRRRAAGSRIKLARPPPPGLPTAATAHTTAPASTSRYNHRSHLRIGTNRGGRRGARPVRVICCVPALHGRACDVSLARPRAIEPRRSDGSRRAFPRAQPCPASPRSTGECRALPLGNHWQRPGPTRLGVIWSRLSASMPFVRQLRRSPIGSRGANRRRLEGEGRSGGEGGKGATRAGDPLSCESWRPRHGSRAGRVRCVGGDDGRTEPRGQSLPCVRI